MTRENELALTGGGLNRPTASEHFTVAAWRLLTGERDNSQRAVEAIRANPAVLEEVRARWEDLQAAVAPAGDEAVHACLLEAASVYGSPWDNDDLASIGMARYFAVLSELPAEAVRAGFDAYDRQPDSKYFPRPGALLALAEPTARKLRIAAGRARLARERLPSKAATPRTPEELAKDKAALIAAGHLNEDGSFKPLGFKRGPAPPPSTRTIRAPKPLSSILKNDPALQALRENPIGPGRKQTPSEFA